jgi:hypothetical protein
MVGVELKIGVIVWWYFPNLPIVKIVVNDYALAWVIGECSVSSRYIKTWLP